MGFTSCSSPKAKWGYSCLHRHASSELHHSPGASSHSYHRRNPPGVTRSYHFFEVGFTIRLPSNQLHPTSRPITTFATQKGLYQYTQLMFGVSSAPEIYRHIIQQILQGCPGVRNISDDIIVFGKTRHEHDQNLEKVLQRLQNAGLTLNQDKCIFGVSNVTFFGHEMSASGISPHTKNV